MDVTDTAIVLKHESILIYKHIVKTKGRAKNAQSQPETHSNSILMFNKLSAIRHFKSWFVFSSFIEN